MKRHGDKVGQKPLPVALDRLRAFHLSTRTETLPQAAWKWCGEGSRCLWESSSHCGASQREWISFLPFREEQTDC